jgi:hypothetical protein
MSLNNKKKIFIRNNKIISILNDKNNLDIKKGKEEATKLNSLKNDEENDSNFLTSLFLGNIDYDNNKPSNKFNADKESNKIKISSYISSKDILFSDKSNEFEYSINNNSIKSFNEETENGKNKSLKQNLTNTKFEKSEEEVEDLSFMSNNSIMNFLSENAINMYLKNGNNMDIDEFFKNYIENQKNRDIKQLRMIMSSQEFQSKAQKYRKNIFDLSNSFPSNDNNMFLNRKHNLSGNKIILNNNEKNYSFNKKNKIDLNLSHNNIKIKNNKIIKEVKEKNAKNKEYIDYQRIFTKQFVKKKQK